ncbi:flagellar hook-associated protein FlgL [Blastopirellula sp. JC732]|uniref:Flagellar hook-associated protein FlgL n=1 Tax=Blastopirellula sediminis TaxID=2894196 RepID=A0A9X1MLZ4_9BACT|nr:flagellar hook-associated protein FlgL [Blastopirellula sediminis]MCC9607666.1 flagellar hook-associated protein FlgL [Blastopirellula sediminis]MCC9629041.1 flagellar hook-associated protein FlgL [Blastopirellula sediminis]
MTRIVPVPTTRVSDGNLQSRLLSQLAASQASLFNLQNQLSTGRRLLAPSDDAPAAIRGITLQSLIERKTQISVNLTTSQSYLSATDTAMAGAADLLSEMRGLAVIMVDSTATDTEVAAASQQFQNALQQFLDIGNRQFRGRYLFGGSNTTTTPFTLKNGLVTYNGNTNGLNSFADVDLLFDTTVNGNTAFGAISPEVKSKIDLNPVLTLDTKLSDLRGGAGIAKGSFVISDGTNPVTIDIRSAETIGDVISLIERNPPPGRKITARIDNNGLNIDIDDAGGGNLTIREEGGSHVAAQLGILKTNGNGVNPIEGADLNPIITKATKISDLLGSRAQAIISYAGNNNDIVLNAKNNGADANGVTLNLVNDDLLQAKSGLTKGNEVVSFAEDLQRAQTTLDLDGAGNSLLLTANSTDGSLDGVHIVFDSSADIGDSAVIGPTTTINGVKTITVQIDDTDETSLQTLSDAFLADGRFSVGFDNSTGETYNPSSSVLATNSSNTYTATVSQTGVKARAALPLSGGNNDLILTANQAGIDFNNVNIVIDASGDIGDAATATYTDDGTTRTLTLSVDDSDETSLQTLMNAIIAEGSFSVRPDNSNGNTFNPSSFVSSVDDGPIGNTGNSGGDENAIFVRVDADRTNANHLVNALNNNAKFSELYSAEIDEHDTVSDFQRGSGLVDLTVTGTFQGGSGADFDAESGLQITNGGETQVITLEDAETVEDLLNILNGAGLGVLAEINSAGSGINLRSVVSGGNFSIGENGGTTASQLGLRTFSESTLLSSLNFGLGVNTTDGTDFTITRNDGKQLEIDLSSAKTVGDVLNLINNHPDNQDGSPVVAKLADFGNGIQLIDDNPDGIGRLTIERDNLSTAAIDLGLMPEGALIATVSDSPTATPAAATVEFTPPGDTNNAIQITANLPGTTFNNVQVEFVNSAASGDQAIVNYDPTTKKLTIDVDPAATTANTVIAAINAEGTFSADLSVTNDPTNNGTGLIADTGVLAATNGGTPVADAEPATASVSFASPENLNTGFTLESLYPGTRHNDVQIIFTDTLTSGSPTAVYNSGAKTLTVSIDAGVTTTADIVNAINLEGTFHAELDRSVDTTNNGTGTISATGTVGTTSGGTAEVLSGKDVNLRETKSVFNTLIKLNEAIVDRDYVQISRLVESLDADLSRLSFSRGELGARSQNVDLLKTRLDDDMIELQANLSAEIDVDFVEAASNFAAQQASYQASLQTIGQIYQLSLLDYL